MALPYRRAEAKAWAKATMRGVCNVVMPTFTGDLRRLNPAAIRHDLRRSVACGFWGSLLASECGTTLEEMRQFIEIAAAEAPAGYHLVLHGSFDTLEDVIAMCRVAEGAGCTAVLLAYPLTFYPQSVDDIVAYTEAVSRATNLAIILFAIGFWGFRRLHPSAFPPEALVRMAQLDTVVALKYECGHPGTGGMVEIQKRLGHLLVVTDPFEHNAPVWVDAYGMQWLGTSYYNYFGDRIPRLFRLMHDGRWEEAMALYWQLQPCREAYQAVRATISGASLVHRLAWKYMDWLNGFNGGPIRMPHMRLHAGQMRLLRDGAVQSGLDVTTDPDDRFFVGRHPG
ncbi:MAG: dihydrodipicolinate synthase family protein [Firmicutes bacterium]|jgi:dihydrodipicolinate synthase/N-acetylneuraminate lyase|nr:dihydrodipicolinate synthase family protein [Bacillota bacterium]